MTIDAGDGLGEGAEPLIRHFPRVYFSWPDKRSLPVPSSRALDESTNERWIGRRGIGGRLQILVLISTINSGEGRRRRIKCRGREGPNSRVRAREGSKFSC